MAQKKLHSELNFRLRKHFLIQNLNFCFNSKYIDTIKTYMCLNYWAQTGRRKMRMSGEEEGGTEWASKERQGCIYGQFVPPSAYRVSPLAAE